MDASGLGHRKHLSPQNDLLVQAVKGFLPTHDKGNELFNSQLKIQRNGCAHSTQHAEIPCSLYRVTFELHPSQTGGSNAKSHLSQVLSHNNSLRTSTFRLTQKRTHTAPCNSWSFLRTWKYFPQKSHCTEHLVAKVHRHRFLSECSLAFCAKLMRNSSTFFFKHTV